MRKYLAAKLCFAFCVGASVTGHAADLYSPPPRAAAPEYIEARTRYNWTGFYLGGNLGGAWADSKLTEAASGLSWSHDQSQFTGGVQAGYNQQFGWFVLGIEGTSNWTSIEGSSGVIGTPIGVLQGQVKTDWIGTIAGRVGVAADNWLFYAKGGWAWVDATASINNLTTGGSVSTSKTLDGALIGGGIEYAISRNWTAKVEYNYIALDGRQFWGGPIGGAGVKIDNDVQTLTVGINYKF